MKKRVKTIKNKSLSEKSSNQAKTLETIEKLVNNATTFQIGSKIISFVRTVRDDFWKNGKEDQLFTIFLQNLKDQDKTAQKEFYDKPA